MGVGRPPPSPVPEPPHQVAFPAPLGQVGDFGGRIGCMMYWAGVQGRRRGEGRRGKRKGWLKVTTVKKWYD